MTYYKRNLPHWHPPNQDIFITWRLHGSLPAQFRAPKKTESPGKNFVTYDRALDQAKTGPLWLNDPRVAESVINTLKSAQQNNLFKLQAYALMANHVHVLLAPQSSLARITHQIKGATARAANKILNLNNTHFWQDESFDRWIRDQAEWQRVRTYIEQNPVAAGLVAQPKDWPWSSASNPI
jgi:putative transposase